MKIYFLSAYTLIASFLIGLGSIAYAGTASNVINFTATFVGGSCEINAPAKIQFNDGTPFSSQEIEQKTAATQQEFEINLTNCAGTGLIPSITVSGMKTTDFGEALFRDSGGETSANGYGILLESLGNSSFESNSNLASQGVISAPDWTSDMKLNTIDTTLKIVASLRCGDCNYSGRRGGELKANVTFDFVYE